MPDGISPELVCEESEGSKKKKKDEDQCVLGAHAVTSGNSIESNLKKVAQRSVLYEIRKKTRNIQYCKILGSIFLF